jgi:hypothetical protein
MLFFEQFNTNNFVYHFIFQASRGVYQFRRAKAIKKRLRKQLVT